MRLLRTPQPYSDESLMGYIIRLTEANGYDSPNLIIKNAGWQWSSPRQGWRNLTAPTKDFDKFYELIGKVKEKNPLFEEEQASSFNYMLLYNHLLPKEMVDFMNAKICSVCLQENSYHRRIWDFILITACPIHQIMLVDICPRCGDKISWKRNSINFCQCGYDFSKCKEKKVSSKQMILPNLFYQKLGFDEISYDKSSSNPLDQVSLEKLSKFLLVLTEFYWSEKGVLKFREYNNRFRHNIFTKFYGFFSDYPKNIEKMFIEIFRLEEINYFLRALSDCCDNEELFFVLALLKEYENPSEGYPDINEIRNLKEKYVALEDHPELFKYHKSNINTLIEKKWLSPPIYVNDFYFRKTYFLRNKVNAINKRLNKVTSLYGLACLLEISGEQIQQLEDYRVISKTKDLLITDFGWNDFYYDCEEADKLICRIRQVIDSNHNPEDELVSPEEIYSLFSDFQINIGAFIKKVLNLEFRPIKEVKNSGLFRFSFLYKDIENYANQYFESLRIKNDQENPDDIISKQKTKNSEIKAGIKKASKVLKEYLNRESRIYFYKHKKRMKMRLNYPPDDAMSLLKIAQKYNLL